MGGDAVRTHERSNGSGLGHKLALGLGKFRRLYLTTFRPRKVEWMLEQRRGECVRCGACCKLGLTCPHLDESNLPTCLIHLRRHRNCRHFPLDERDLFDRDRVSPETKCGYWFVNGGRA